MIVNQCFNGNSVLGDWAMPYDTEWLECDMLDEGLELDYDASTKMIVKRFDCSHGKPIVKVLLRAGLKLVCLNYYSPREYNFQSDCVDITIKVCNKKRLLAWIRKNKQAIQEVLDANESYDGYMSYTPSNYDEVLERALRGDVNISVMVALFEDFRDEYDEEDRMVFLQEASVFKKTEVEVSQ